jgi:hypothetical protein
MLKRQRTGFLGLLRSAFLIGFAGFPPAIGFAVGQEPAGKAAPEAQKPPGAPVAVLRGRVTSKLGRALPGVRVLVAIPATDMRQLEPDASRRLLETKSDAKGDYVLELPGIARRTTISIDATMPGFRKLSGTLMAGGDDRTVEVEPGGTVEANLPLEPSRYHRGVVVDEQGKPIPAAAIISTLTFKDGEAYVEITASGPDGAFELFNYPLFRAQLIGFEAAKGTVIVSQPDHVESRIDDVYAIPPDKRGDLRVVLGTGRKVTGTVLGLDGKPVARAMVEVNSKTPSRRKATLTDADGHFALRGLDGGPTTLIASALEIKQKARLSMDLVADKDAFEVRLQPIVQPAHRKTYEVLGMQLADVTPEWKSAYDLYHDRGAVILDPGPDPDRLKIGPLAEGYYFWLVGEKVVHSVREFVDEILAEAAEAADPDASEAGVRVVYGFKTPEFQGTNTQSLKLTKDDLAQLKTLSDRWKAEPK